jgi:hypothetical protein
LKSIISTFIIAITLSSCFICRLSEQVFQEAISQIQMSDTTNTPEPILTPTLGPTLTLTITSTFPPSATQTPVLTPTATQTSTPTQDLRIVKTGPKDLMLSKEDLPSEAQYYLPNEDMISQLSNTEIISSWGVEEGELYLEETGRIDGWVVTYRRGTSAVGAPEELYQNIVQYETSEGANIAFTKYGFITLVTDFSLIDHDLIIGDDTSVYMRKTLETNNQYLVDYVVQSRYKNYYFILIGSGWENELDLDYVVRIAEIAMDKIKSAPLGNW